ncbi:hypothetical protein IAT40_006433 [Kwoniella sp. CBS 6097]
MMLSTNPFRSRSSVHSSKAPRTSRTTTTTTTATAPASVSGTASAVTDKVPKNPWADAMRGFLLLSGTERATTETRDRSHSIGSTLSLDGPWLDNQGAESVISLGETISDFEPDHDSYQDQDQDNESYLEMDEVGSEYGRGWATGQQDEPGQYGENQNPRFVVPTTGWSSLFAPSQSQLHPSSMHSQMNLSPVTTTREALVVGHGAGVESCLEAHSPSSSMSEGSAALMDDRLFRAGTGSRLYHPCCESNSYNHSHTGGPGTSYLAEKMPLDPPSSILPISVEESHSDVKAAQQDTVEWPSDLSNVRREGGINPMDWSSAQSHGQKQIRPQRQSLKDIVPTDRTDFAIEDGAHLDIFQGMQLSEDTWGTTSPDMVIGMGRNGERNEIGIGPKSHMGITLNYGGW